jgi:diguanylate cyclase (GGDEF)-like protein
MVLTIGVLNLALGFALALGLARFPSVARRLWPDEFVRPVRRPRPPSNEPSSPPAVEASAAEGATGKPPSAQPSRTTAFPQGWDEAAAEDIPEPDCFDQALLWLMRRDLTPVREQLLRADERHRNGTSMADWLEDLRSASDRWLDRVSAWTAESSVYRDASPDEELHAQLEELLLDHSYRVKSCMDALAELQGQAEGPASQRSIICELAGFFSAINGLRDEATCMLADQLERDGRVAELAEPLRMDDSPTRLSRLGLSGLFHEWWSKDSERIRLVSGILVDVDRVSKLNEARGLRAVDHLLAAFGDLLRTQIRQKRGFDRVARFSGQGFWLFFGDTSARNAALGIERIRQTIEATSFRLSGGDSFELTASCAAAEIGKTESSTQFAARLRKLVGEAKKDGRNRSWVHDEDGPRAIEPTSQPVKGKLIEVECPAPAEGSGSQVAGRR